MFLFADIDPLLLQVFAIIFGLIVGSFLNVVIYRLPLMMTSQVQGGKIFNLLLPRSHCPHCDHKLRIIDNLPVLSYLFLKGRCAHCQSPISAQYPLVECLSALLTWFAVRHFGFSIEFFASISFLLALLALTVIDINEQLLPDIITLPLLWLGLIVNISHKFTSPESAIAGAAAGYLSLWSVYWVFKLLTKKEGMGYGDFKLLAALGAWCGWQALPPIIVISSLLGSIAGIFLMVFCGRSRHQPLPFGPWLSVAGVVVFLWRDYLNNIWLFSDLLLRM